MCGNGGGYAACPTPDVQDVEGGEVEPSVLREQLLPEMLRWGRVDNGSIETKASELGQGIGKDSAQGCIVYDNRVKVKVQQQGRQMWHQEREGDAAEGGREPQVEQICGGRYPRKNLGIQSRGSRQTQTGE